MDYIVGSYRPRVLSIIDRVRDNHQFCFHGRCWNGINGSTSYVDDGDSHRVHITAFEEIGMIKTQNDIQNLNLKIKGR